jgi:hypothetical protein
MSAAGRLARDRTGVAGALDEQRQRRSALQHAADARHTHSRGAAFPARREAPRGGEPARSVYDPATRTYRRSETAAPAAHAPKRGQWEVVRAPELIQRDISRASPRANETATTISHGDAMERWRGPGPQSASQHAPPPARSGSRGGARSGGARRLAEAEARRLASALFGVDAPATRAAVRLPSLDVAKARRVLGALAADGSWLSARALAVGLGALGVEEVFVGAMVHEVCGYVGQSTEGEEDEQLVELEEYLAFVTSSEAGAVAVDSADGMQMAAELLAERSVSSALDFDLQGTRARLGLAGCNPCHRPISPTRVLYGEYCRLLVLWTRVVCGLLSSLGVTVHACFVWGLLSAVGASGRRTGCSRRPWRQGCPSAGEFQLTFLSSK